MKTTEFVKKIIPQVLEYYGLPEITGGRHSKRPCPICGKKGKFRIDNKDNTGSWICVCGAGDIWKLLTETTGKDFKTLAREIDQHFGNEYERPVVEEKTGPTILDLMIKRVGISNKITGTNVEQYLNSRGIFEIPQKNIVESSGNMLAIASDALNKPVYSHETFLNGSQKADLETQKKMFSLIENTEYSESVAIRMFPVQSTLGIAEGIETALSCRQIYKCSVWSTLNSSLMKKFRAPVGVDHLIIFADNDKNGTGLAAAFECGNRNILSKNDVKKVTIRWPGSVCDFNDMLVNGSDVFQWQLTGSGQS